MGIALVFATVILGCGPIVPARANPLVPPCNSAPEPAYPAIDAPPRFVIENGANLGPVGASPDCTGWQADPRAMIVGVSARFRDPGGTDGLLARIGAVSTLTGVRYWSVREKKWNSLFDKAFAVDGAASGSERPNFSAADLRGGKDVYFVQIDNRSGHQVTYRLRIGAATANHLAFEVENVTALKWLIIPLFDARQIRSAFFLDREGGDVWDYYGLLDIGGGASLIGTGHDASFLNRAIAIYRHIAGIPTDRDPPAIR